MHDILELGIETTLRKWKDFGLGLERPLVSNGMERLGCLSDDEARVGEYPRHRF